MTQIQTAHTITGPPAGGGPGAIPLAQAAQQQAQPAFNPNAPAAAAPVVNPLPGNNQNTFVPPPVPAQAAPVAPPQPLPPGNLQIPTAPAQAASAPIQEPGANAMMSEMAANIKMLTDERVAQNAKAARQGVLDVITGTTGTGSEAEWQKFTQWAAGGGMDPTAIAAMNTVLASGDAATQTAFVAGYAQIYKAANAVPQHVTGNPAAGVPQTNPGYLSGQDFATIMKSEKYKTDPGYAQTQNALRASSRGMEKAQGFR